MPDDDVNDAVEAARGAVLRYREALEATAQQIEKKKGRKAALDKRIEFAKLNVKYQDRIVELQHLADLHKRGQATVSQVVFPARRLEHELNELSEGLEMLLTEKEREGST
jgi:hypothetical protein